MDKTSSRRAHRRRAVQLEVTISLKGPKSKHIGAGEGLKLVGRVRNLSEAGIAFIVSAGNIDRYLRSPGLPFEIKINLPDGPVKLEAAPVHYQRNPTSSGTANYVIGSRFLNVANAERDALTTFLRNIPPSD